MNTQTSTQFLWVDKYSALGLLCPQYHHSRGDYWLGNAENNLRYGIRGSDPASFRDNIF